MKQTGELALTDSYDWDKNYSDIISHFEQLNFTDTIGHPLTNCVDFIHLVKLLSPILDRNSSYPSAP
jgi:hypothetical protein